MCVIPAREVKPRWQQYAVTTMINLLKRLLREEDGPTAVEYAVMLSLILVACLVAINSMTTATANSFDTSAAAIADAFS
jgi:pilus assembly protein Flp/PilA